MFWKLFSSERRVQEAIDQSVGYDISPNILNPVPANADHQPDTTSSLSLWKDYSFFMPANTQDSAKPRADNRGRKKKA